jgi:pimeloyl-ACP methyl ester carboxylesterase
MKRITAFWVFFITVVLSSPPLARADKAGNDWVILLHGMGRTGFSMRKMARYLDGQGYRTVNITYPSTRLPIPVIAETIVKPAVDRCLADGAERVHVVSHSLGGIVIRQYLQDHSLPSGSRIVMMGPPNRGSEIADLLKDVPLYRWLMGEAGQSLGTAETSFVNTLKPVNATIGIIAGTRTVAPVCSFLIPGADDGKVSVFRTQLDEMTDFVTVPRSHPFMASSRPVMREVAGFLEHGRFGDSGA